MNSFFSVATAFVGMIERIIRTVPIPVPAVLNLVPGEKPARAGVVVAVAQELES